MDSMRGPAPDNSLVSLCLAESPENPIVKVDKSIPKPYILKYGELPERRMERGHGRAIVRL